jgi:prepilin-type N-terminal cleavage/methylation domain-containing protein
MHLRQPRRAGFSLLEVIVSMAVFLFSLVSLGFLLNVSGNMAMAANFKSHAASLAQTILAEVAAGSIALDGQSDVPFEDDPDYHWSLQSEQGVADGLHNVTVKVSRTMPGGQPVEVSLSQMILDPRKVGTVYDTPATISEAEEAAGTAPPETGTASQQQTPAPSATPPAKTSPDKSKDNKGGK